MPRHTVSKTRATSATPMSLDRIIGELSAIAQDGGNRDQIKALAALTRIHGTGGAPAGVPAPLTDQDCVDRLVRLMKPLGQEIGARAFLEAYKAEAPPIPEAPPASPPTAQGSKPHEAEGPAPAPPVKLRHPGLAALLRA